MKPNEIERYYAQKRINEAKAKIEEEAAYKSADSFHSRYNDDDADFFFDEDENTASFKFITEQGFVKYELSEEMFNAFVHISQMIRYAREVIMREPKCYTDAPTNVQALIEIIAGQNLGGKEKQLMALYRHSPSIDKRKFIK